MKIVKEYGRNDGYNFEIDKKLLCIKNGDYSAKKNTGTKNTLAINSFMTIWLLTLPEKFKEWFEKRNSIFNVLTEVETVVYFTGIPSFPHFAEPNLQTSLTGTQDKDKYEFLPTTWTLMECFQYYYHQKGILWSTESIEAEWNSENNTNSQNNLPETTDISSDRSDDKVAAEEETKEGVSNDDNNFGFQTENDNTWNEFAAIKKDTDEEEEIRRLRAKPNQQRKSPSSSTN
jgi:hypothetical protein